VLAWVTVLSSIQSNRAVPLTQHRPSCLLPLKNDYETYSLRCSCGFWCCVDSPVDGIYCRRVYMAQKPRISSSSSSTPQWKPRISQTAEVTQWTKDSPFTRGLPTQRKTKEKRDRNTPFGNLPRYQSIRVAHHQHAPVCAGSAAADSKCYRKYRVFLKYTEPFQGRVLGAQTTKKVDAYMGLWTLSLKL
jgi:hypothetical protein